MNEEALLSRTIGDLKDEIQEVDEEIEALKLKTADLLDQKAKLESHLSRLKRHQSLQAVLNLVYEVNEENSMEVKLQKNSKTTPIIDDFYASDAKFLILRNFYSTEWVEKIEKRKTDFGIVVSEIRKRTVLSLIIIRVDDVKGRFSVINTGLTITDLKMALEQNQSHYLRGNTRLSALADEISQLDFARYEPLQCVPFTSACWLGAQTYRNQNGYGPEWANIHEGARWGETTGFLIIGVRFER